VWERYFRPLRRRPGGTVDENELRQNNKKNSRKEMNNFKKRYINSGRFAQTVHNPNSRPIFIDGFKPFRINRLNFVLDDFLPFLDSLTPSKNFKFFEVLGMC
jgi:hypothetical protein